MTSLTNGSALFSPIHSDKSSDGALNYRNYGENAPPAQFGRTQRLPVSSSDDIRDDDEWKLSNVGRDFKLSAHPVSPHALFFKIVLNISLRRKKMVPLHYRLNLGKTLHKTYETLGRLCQF